MGIKEHKYQFQSSSNQHQDLSRVLVVAYSMVLLVSSVSVRYFGVSGFMWAWLAAEVAQTIAIVKMNQKLFPNGGEVTMKPIWKLALVTTVVFAGATYPAFRAVHESLTVIFVVAVAYSLVTAMFCYKIFGLSDVAEEVMGRWRARAIPAHVPQ
jgi:hypothetical protein